MLLGRLDIAIERVRESVAALSNLAGLPASPRRAAADLPSQLSLSQLRYGLCG